MGRTVTVALGQHYEDFIKSSIETGRYNNASEVVRAALRRLEEDEARLKALRSALDEGEASADVEDFDPKSFLKGLKEERKLKNG
ncbi:MAG: type II toxin-antitoxin system ParD family antitoxin [Bacteroidales bacterium]|nr:type II toxin-antitoxin system ParD family antitoxin [Bacteroidales bacterium]